MADSVVGRWILENKQKYFSGSSSLPPSQSNDLQAIIHAGWKEEDSIVVQHELRDALISAYPDAPKGGQTDREASYQQGMRCAGRTMMQKYGNFWPQGAVWNDFKWRLIDQLMAVESCMGGPGPAAPRQLRGENAYTYFRAGRKRKTRKSKSRARKTRRRHK